MPLREDTRTRILLYFLLGIALPSGLLGYLAFRGIQNDRALVERERRVRLEEVAAALGGTADSLLREVGASVSGTPADSLGRLVRERLALQAVFTRQEAEGARVVAAEGLLFDGETRPVEPTGEGAFARRLRSARDRELRAGAPDAALGLYRRALEEAIDDTERARALAGVARVQRKLRRWDSALASYERLRTELGDLPAPPEMPSGPAAAIELGGILLETGDTTRAATVLLELQEDLASGRWRLTPARFDFLAETAAERLDALIAVGASGPELERSRTLRREMAESRERALALLAFEREAGELLRRGAPAGMRFTVGAGDASLPAVLLSPSAGSGDGVARGFILDPGGFARTVIDHAGREELSGVSWELRAATGSTVASSEASAAPGEARVATTLPGLPSWTLELSPSADSVEGGFFTSRRAVYFYAFLLLAGILLFGLTLTIRSVGRELELARMKSDFVSTVSHEFKSPLTAIRQLAEMLRSDRVPSEERRRRYYDVLLEQSERLSMLVDNVLDFARMESGRHALALQRVDLAELVEDTVADARRRVAHEGFAIRGEVERPLPPASLDPDAVRQALGNLVDNAVKYSGSSREVVVRAFAENGEVVLSVRDFGIGLAPEEVDRVFERFYRAGDELTRRVKGTGLGLTLVRHIVTAHGGSVDVRSRPNKGSTFLMRFPADRAASMQKAAAPEEPE